VRNAECGMRNAECGVRKASSPRRVRPVRTGSGEQSVRGQICAVSYFKSINRSSTS
jgi:hypothetical protein